MTTSTITRLGATGTRHTKCPKIGEFQGSCQIDECTCHAFEGCVALPVYSKNGSDEIQLYDLVIDGEWQGSCRTLPQVTQLARELVRVKVKKNE